MNNHINDCRIMWAQVARVEFLRQCPEVPFDHMPVEVAVEMLLAPKARMSARERKECMRARETRYASPRTRKSVAAKLTEKYTENTLEQLCRWNRRARSNRADGQRQYQLLAKQLDKLSRAEVTPLSQYAGALAKRRQAELDVLDAHFNLVAGLTLAEITSRV